MSLRKRNPSVYKKALNSEGMYQLTKDISQIEQAKSLDEVRAIVDKHLKNHMGLRDYATMPYALVATVLKERAHDKEHLKDYLPLFDAAASKEKELTRKSAYFNKRKFNNPRLAGNKMKKSPTQTKLSFKSKKAYNVRTIKELGDLILDWSERDPLLESVGKSLVSGNFLSEAQYKAAYQKVVDTLASGYYGANWGQDHKQQLMELRMIKAGLDDIVDTLAAKDAIKERGGASAIKDFDTYLEKFKKYQLGTQAGEEFADAMLKNASRKKVSLKERFASAQKRKKASAKRAANLSKATNQLWLMRSLENLHSFVQGILSENDLDEYANTSYDDAAIELKLKGRLFIEAAAFLDAAAEAWVRLQEEEDNMPQEAKQASVKKFNNPRLAGNKMKKSPTQTKLSFKSKKAYNVRTIKELGDLILDWSERDPLLESVGKSLVSGNFLSEAQYKAAYQKVVDTLASGYYGANWGQDHKQQLMELRMIKAGLDDIVDTLAAKDAIKERGGASAIKDFDTYLEKFKKYQLGTQAGEEFADAMLKNASRKKVSLKERFASAQKRKKASAKSITVTYEKWDEEALDAGDTDDKGVYDEYSCDDVEDAINYLSRKGPFEPSSSHVSKRDNGQFWLSSSDDDIDYRTGDRTSYGYHLKGFSDDEFMEILSALKADRLVSVNLQDVGFPRQAKVVKRISKRASNFKNLGRVTSRAKRASYDVQRLAELLKSAERYNQISISGNRYDAPKGMSDSTFDGMMADFETFYPAANLLGRWKATFDKIGVTYSEEEFDEQGSLLDDEAEPRFSIDFEFLTKDGGRVTYEFHGRDDSHGFCEIQDDSPQADEAYALLNEGTGDIEELVKSLQSKIKTAGRKTRVSLQPKPKQSSRFKTLRRNSR